VVAAEIDDRIAIALLQVQDIEHHIERAILPCVRLAVDEIASHDHAVSLPGCAQLDEAVAVAGIGVPVAVQVGDDHRHAGVERPESRRGFCQPECHQAAPGQ